MKKLLVIAAVAALAGCDLPPPAEAPAPLPATDMPAPDAGAEQAVPTEIVTEV